jgi:MFS-type transporter involved in bile tolerance (Atg22 family)
MRKSNLILLVCLVAILTIIGSIISLHLTDELDDSNGIVLASIIAPIIGIMQVTRKL